MAQIAYDEEGSSFLYFLASFFGMVLIPFTYWFWPRGMSEEMKRVQKLENIHGDSKWFQTSMDALKKKQNKPSVMKFVIATAWVAFAVLVYRAALVENEHIEYDPYEVLGVGLDADNTTIKKAYRQLSKENHPDKGGDPDAFMRIRKAYEALTDEETRRNWEEYGNPDGPQAMQFGIALPSWIVDGQNSVWVLGAYVLAFMIIMPVVVGIWWNRSIKYSKEKVLLSTTQLYYHFFHRSPHIDIKRALTILSASFEFWREHNPDIRAPTPEDNVEVPEMIRILGTPFDPKGKEPPLNMPYSIKARTLLYSHFAKYTPSQALVNDRDYILRKCPTLIQEMVGCLTQLTAMAHAGRANMPKLETVEAVMKLSPMMVQGLKEAKSPLLQLPHFAEEYLKYCQSKKFSVRNLRALATLNDSDRRQILRNMEDDEYERMVACLKGMPLIEADAHTQVLDDEEEHVITAGAIVTVSVSIVRKSLADLEEQAPKIHNPSEKNDEDEQDQTHAAGKSNKKIWEVNKKKKGPKKKAKKNTSKKSNQKDQAQQQAGDAEKNVQEEADEEFDDNDRDAVEDIPVDGEEDGNDSEESIGDDDAEWDAMQETFRKKKKKASDFVSKMTHTVYAPDFPVEKQEWWWVYICCRPRHLLLTVPVQVCNLTDKQEIELKLPAPKKKGHCTYELWVRSDSYFGCDLKKDLKFDVQEERVMEEDHPQWKIEESDEDEDAVVEESEDEGISTDASDAS